MTSRTESHYYCSPCQRDLGASLQDREAHELVAHGGRNVTRRIEALDAEEASDDESRTCTDWRCTDGITMCPGCNGYGVLRRNGKKFTLRGRGKHITEQHTAHDTCSGTGLAACGCTPLDDVAALTLTGAPVQTTELDDAWSEHATTFTPAL